MKQLTIALLIALIAATILTFAFDTPPWARLLLPFLTLAFFLKFFVRGPSRRSFASTNLGGGYQSGGSMPHRPTDPNTTGDAPLSAEATRIIGAGAANNNGRGNSR